MSSIYDYIDYPQEEDWLRLRDKKGESFDKIKFTENKGTENFNPVHRDAFRDIELSFLFNEFNDKALELSNSYVLMMHFYKKGIPDQEWYIQTEKGYKLFPYFEVKHHTIHQWFCFYMDCYYSKFSSLIDTLAHIINLRYRLGVKIGRSFRILVVRKLEKEDKDLFNILQAFIKNETYKKVESFRNDLTHNYRPNRISSGIRYEEKEGRMVPVGITILGEYTTTTEFVENIEASIDLLGNLMETIREKIEIPELKETQK